MNYAMFTEHGNAAVHQIVLTALMFKQSPDTVYKALSNLARVEDFGEATDTAVRESVFEACGFYE